MTTNTTTAGKCPVMHGAGSQTTFAARSNRDWWPNQLNLKILHQHSAKSNPMGADFSYANLTDADLSGCEIDGCDTSGAKLPMRFAEALAASA